MDSKKIKDDMFVVLTYTIFDLENNIIEKVDSPISHIQGFGKKLLQKIEDKLNGKQAGDELEVRIEPDDGFGNYDDSLIIKDKLSNVPEEYRKKDELISFVNEKGDKKDFRVIDLNNDTITLDGNHYLAGKELVYKIRILDVRESTPFDKEQAQINMLNG
tara:strand:+ start:171 stop:650 length:480 start_codon:yes stop_codon:yes gene_type:complete